jgi:hypothetical protein
MLSLREDFSVTRRAAVEAMLQKYGSPAILNHAEIRAVIRPLQIHSGVDNDVTGGNAGLYYRYTGPAEYPLSEGDTVACDEVIYCVRRAGTAVIAGEPLYEWAILKRLSPSAPEEIMLISPDGTVLARAKGYEIKTLHSTDEVRSWGEGSPLEIEEGETSYELRFYDVALESGTPLSKFGEFQVEIRGQNRQMIYSGCRIKTEAESGGILLPPQCSLIVLATGKTEVNSV